MPQEGKGMCEKTFNSSKQFVDYQTTNEYQLCNFSSEGVPGKTINFLT